MEIGNIYGSARHFSSAGPVVHNEEGVKCQPFLNIVTIGYEH